jgi:hypothetical protein
VGASRRERKPQDDVERTVRGGREQLEDVAPRTIERLQRTIGNRAITRLVASGRTAQRVPAKAKAGWGKATRLIMAQAAIDHTKKVFAYGAGNQIEAVKATNANAHIRMQVLRDEKNEYWDIAPEVSHLINANPEAFIAAKADIAQGGNAGEHADVAFDYLRSRGSGEQISKCQQNDLDHVFIIIGDLASDADEDLVVADPWPTRAEALAWSDHFAHVSDRRQITTHASAVSDGTNAKDVIKAGIRLNEKGKRMLTTRLSDKETAKLIEKGRSGDHPWMWTHPSTRRSTP